MKSDVLDPRGTWESKKWSRGNVLENEPQGCGNEQKYKAKIMLFKSTLPTSVQGLPVVRTGEMNVHRKCSKGVYVI